MSIAKDEVFGPVTCIMKVSDNDEAVRIANDTQYGLSSCVFAKNVSDCMSISNRLEAGQVFVNNYFNVDVAVPFAGWKNSGYGMELGKESVESFLKQKSVHLSF